MAIPDGKGLRAGVRRVKGSRPIAEILEGRQLLSTITVTSAGDADGADGSNTLSLRQAIEIANGTLPVASLTKAQQGLVSGAASTPETIDFAIPGAGPFTITPATPLPAITVPVVVDGYSQPGASPNTGGPGMADNAIIRVGISGVLLPGDSDQGGLTLSGGNSTVQGLALFDFSGSASIGVGSQPGGGLLGDTQPIFEIFNASGISIQGKGGDVVRGNFIGLDPSGNPGSNKSSIGVVDTNSPGAGDTIGGTAAADRNVISGNDTGIMGGDLIEGNSIGTDASGTKILNNFIGINQAGTIGGTAAGAGNLISGNGTGIMAGGLIEGNLIGTDITGTNPLGNGIGVDAEGIGVSTIGGTAAGARNVISGNPAYGIFSFGSTNLIEGNFIGTDPTGTRAIPNGVGVFTYGILGTIGGTAAGEGNLISGNGGDGIYLAFSYQRTGNVLVEGNLIGTDASGKAPLPNAGDGVAIEVPSNTVGGTAAGAGNVIAFNDKAGIDITTSTIYGSSAGPPTGITVSGNSIFANVGLGIDLGSDGVTPNNPAGSPTAPNLLQPYPVLTSATPTATGSLISGTLDAMPSTSYTVEFFSNPAADPSGFGQGQTYLGSTLVTTDASGHAAFTFATPANLGGQSLSATATDPKGNTSEFSRDLPAYSTTTTLALGQPAPTVAGQPLTLLAAVAPAPGAGTPTGQVTFTEDGKPIGTATLDAAGAASLTIPAPLGAHTFAASFAGSAGNPGSASAGVVVTTAAPAPAPTATVTTLAVEGPTVPVGQPLTLLAVVETTPGAGTPTGQVTFTEDGQVIGTAPDAAGTASLTIPAPLGTHTFVASYAGSATFAPSTGQVVVTTAPVATTTTLIGQGTASVFGRPVTFAAVVAPSTPGAAVPTGMVVFAQGGVILGEAPLNAQGVAVFITNGLPSGNVVVEALYLGDSSNAMSLSNFIAQAVQPVAALTTLIGPTAPGRVGQTVTFAAIVSPTVLDNTPTGSVIFGEGGVLLGEAPLNGSGVAVLITDRLSLGANVIEAAYLGDPANAPSLSNFVSVSVRPAGSGKSAVKARAIRAAAVPAHPSGPKYPAHARKGH